MAAAGAHLASVAPASGFADWRLAARLVGPRQPPWLECARGNRRGASETPFVLRSCSGQEILDPREFMERARNEMGAQTHDEWRSQQPGAASSNFTGAGNTLSGDSVQGAAPPPQQPTEHTITFWQNGFTVDDGPLRGKDDPESQAFLAAVNRGARALWPRERVPLGSWAALSCASGSGR
eukprot:4846906-Prymnesium_polylepis.1